MQALALLLLLTTQQAPKEPASEDDATRRELDAKEAHRLVAKLGPVGVKAAMDAAGLYGGPVRAPLAGLPPADRERVAKLVCG